MVIFQILISGFAGYLIGRWSHCYLNVWFNNPKWAPHHWLYGALLILMGLLFFKNNLNLQIILFGIGFFISDLKDFLQFKLIGPDEEGKKKFWGID